MLSALKSLTDNCIISVISVLIPFNWLAHSSQYFPGSYYNRWFLWKPWCFIDHALSVPILFKSSVLTYLLWHYPTWWRWDITSSLPRRAEDHVPIEHPLASKGENSLWLLFWGGSYNCLIGRQWTLAAGRDGSTWLPFHLWPPCTPRVPGLVTSGGHWLSWLSLRSPLAPLQVKDGWMSLPPGGGGNSGSHAFSIHIVRVLLSIAQQGGKPRLPL